MDRTTIYPTTSAVIVPVASAGKSARVNSGLSSSSNTTAAKITGIAIKKYYAVVEGIPKEKTGTIKSYLHENDASLRVYSGSPDEGGKLSITHYEILRSSSNFSLLEVRIETGRKHQIRVHLSDKGHPIVGDDRYGGKTSRAPRLALHCCHLAFKHPVTGKEVLFHSPLPRGFDLILNQDQFRGK